MVAGVKLVPSISTVTLPALPPESGEMPDDRHGGGLRDRDREAGRGGAAGDAVGQDVVGPRRQHLRHDGRLVRLVGDVGRFLVVVRRGQRSLADVQRRGAGGGGAGQRDDQRAAGRHGDLVVVVLVGGGERIADRACRASGAGNDDVELPGAGGQGVVGPVGIGQLVEAVDLHEDVVIPRRQGRHGRGQAGVVRGAGGQAAACASRCRAGWSWT